MKARLKIAASAAALSLALVASGARAQETAEGTASSDQSSTTVGEIVVTAQRREQNLQEVPVSVTAVTSASLVANRINDVQDLNAIAPNVTVRAQPGASNLPVYSIRGIVAAPAAAGADKGVSLYIDGVYVGNSIGSVYAISEIERIEVLKGPQGTLFGRNATGGAISITTMAPTGELGAQVELTAGNFSQRRAKVRLDTPKFGPLSASLSYVHSERRGAIRNLGAGAQFDYSRSGELGTLTSPRYLGGENIDAVAVGLKFDNGGPFNAVYKFDYTDNHFTPQAQGLGAITPNSIAAAIPNFALTAGIVNSLYFQDPATQTNPYPNLTPISKKRPNAVNNWLSFPGHSTTEAHNLTMTFEASNQLTFKNIFGYRAARLSGFQNFDGLGGLRLTNAAVGTAIPLGGGNFAANPGPYTLLAVFSGVPNFLSLPAAQQNAVLLGTINQLSPLVGQPFSVLSNMAYFKSNQLSNEIQANFDSDLVTATVGYLHFEDDQTTGGYPVLPNVVAFSPLPGFSVLPSTPPNQRTKVKIKSDAIYAQPEVHVTDQLTLVAGGRYTWDRKRYNDYTDLLNPQIGARYSSGRFTYLLGANFKVNEDIFVYGKYSTGYISGGQVGGIAFSPETAKSYEIGIKSELFDRRLRANLALFDASYSNLQYTTAGANLSPPRPSLATVVVNSGGAKARGFELEVTAVPVERLMLSGNVGHTDFKYTTPNSSGTFIAQFRPRWTGNAAIQYDTAPFANNGNAHLSFRVDANYESKTYLTELYVYGPYNDNLIVGPQWNLNGRVAIADIGVPGASKMTIALWGKNLTNNKSADMATGLGFMGAVHYREPRTYGIDASIKF